MDKLLKAVFLTLTIIYLISLTFDGVLIRQIITVLFFIVSLFTIAIKKTHISAGAIITVLFLIGLLAVTALISPNDDWKLKVFFVFSGVAFFTYSYALFILGYKKYFIHFLFIVCAIVIARLMIVHDENFIFYNASRNIVATYILFPVICLFIFTRKSNALLIFSLLTIFMCFLLKGRTALLLSFVILCVALYRVFGVKTVLIVIMLSTPFLFFFNLNGLSESITSHTNFSEGLKTTRSVIYDEYFSNFTLADFVFGRSFDGMITINTLNNNPHNSFLLIHSLFGFLPALMLLFMFIIYGWKLFEKNGPITALLFLLIPIKAMTDSVIFFNILDVFYMLPLMFLMAKRKSGFCAISKVTDYQ